MFCSHIMVLRNVISSHKRHNIMIVGHRMVHPLQRTPKLASGAAILLALSSMAGGSYGHCYAFTSTHRPSMLLRRPHHHQPYRSSATALSASTALFGKKKTPGPNHSNKRGGGGGGQPKQEKASVKEARFYAATRQFMFTLAPSERSPPFFMDHTVPCCTVLNYLYCHPRYYIIATW